MAKIRVGLGIFLMVLVFGIMVFSCDINGNGNSNGNVALNGEWTGTEKVEWSVGPHWRFCYNFIFGEGCEFPLCNDCIWVDKTESGYSEVKLELMFNDDNIIFSKHGFPYMKGTYSVNGDKIIINPSHFTGKEFPFGYMVWMEDFEPVWYSKNEFEAELIASNDAGNVAPFPSDQLAAIANFVNDLFASSLSNYSVGSKTLTIENWIFNHNGKNQTFTRKNE